MVYIHSTSYLRTITVSDIPSTVCETEKNKVQMIFLVSTDQDIFLVILWKKPEYAIKADMSSWWPPLLFFVDARYLILGSICEIPVHWPLSTTGMRRVKLLSASRDYPCEKEGQSSFSKYVPFNKTIKCDCSSGWQVCPDNAAGPEPARMVSATTDYLLNMTARNVSDWLVKTNKEFERRR